MNLENKKICFGIKAQWGGEGQGEFLRQMVFALDQFPRAEIFSRFSKSGHTATTNLPVPSVSFETIMPRIPWLSGRMDWRVLASDLEFDSRMASAVRDAALFDGVSGQCCNSLTRLKKNGKTKNILTSLNTHIRFLLETLSEEHQRGAVKTPHFIHPLMHRRAVREIELADYVRVNSEWAKQTFVEQGIPAGKIEVIHPGIDKRHFFSVPKQDHVFRVMTVSSIDPRKGILYLLQAFEELKLPNSELVLIGGTGDRWSKRMLETFMKRNPNIKLRHADIMSVPVQETFGTASVVVHPALEDGFGLAVAQALASGRPVIATRQSGASELIRHGESGFVIERRSVEDLKKYLQLLANDRSLLESMTAKAPLAVKDLSYEKFAEDVHRFYVRCLTES